MFVTLKRTDGGEVDVNPHRIVSMYPINRASNPDEDEPRWVTRITLEGDVIETVQGHTRDIRATIKQEGGR